MKPKAIVITGPTASGKSALAVWLAHHIGGEIICADSRQIYEGIPISTAAPTPEERSAVEHHLASTLPLTDTYSAADFEKEATQIIRNLAGRNLPAIVCGGAMLYVDALCHGIDDLPTVDPALRARLTDEWHRYGDAPMRLRLLGLDPAYYARVDLDNMKRVFHAVEISLQAGRPYSSLLTSEKKDRDFDILKIRLDMPREVLFDRINRRVLQMVGDGLEEEARRVYPMRHLNSLNTVGLKEMFAYIEGAYTLDEAIAKIQKNTRVYAKKQLTWQKRDTSALTFNPLTEGAREEVLKITKKFLETTDD